MKENGLPFPVSSIEFDKIYRVMEMRILLGYTDRELSFLLGYRPLYVRDIENPLHTLRYTPKDTNYLLRIFDCKLPDIMSGKIDEPFYQIIVNIKSYAGGITYTIFRDLPEQPALFKEFTRELENSSEPFENPVYFEEINNFITNLLSGDYFTSPKTALEIFKYCQSHLGTLVKPQILSVVMGRFTPGKKSTGLIQTKNESGRTVYQRIDKKL